MRNNYLNSPVQISPQLVIFLLLLLSRSMAQTCDPSGTLQGRDPPPGQCSQGCCVQGTSYNTYACSPPLSSQNQAYMTLNSFEAGGDGGGPSSCDNKYHSDGDLIVALSTGWFAQGSRCLRNIVVNGNGRSVVVVVVDECDSTTGCDREHGYQPPCSDNVVDASRAVWDALDVSPNAIGGMSITWSDA
ncbi:unnamed protein product [Rhodiola kirilowii]